MTTDPSAAASRVVGLDPPPADLAPRVRQAIAAEQIPDEAVTAAAMAYANAQYGDGAWEAILMGSTRANLRAKARAVLAAALPVLNTARDAETAGRLAKVWPDPFGHWTAEEAEAARAMKRALLSHLPLSDRDTEHAELASLRAEVTELRRRDAESAASLRGEQG